MVTPATFPPSCAFASASNVFVSDSFALSADFPASVLNASALVSAVFAVFADDSALSAFCFAFSALAFDSFFKANTSPFIVFAPFFADTASFFAFTASIFAVVASFFKAVTASLIFVPSVMVLFLDTSAAFACCSASVFAETASFFMVVISCLSAKTLSLYPFVSVETALIFSSSAMIFARDAFLFPSASSLFSSALTLFFSASTLVSSPSFTFANFFSSCSSSERVLEEMSVLPNDFSIYTAQG